MFFKLHPQRIELGHRLAEPNRLHRAARSLLPLVRVREPSVEFQPHRGRLAPAVAKEQGPDVVRGLMERQPEPLPLNLSNGRGMYQILRCKILLL